MATKQMRGPAGRAMHATERPKNTGKTMRRTMAFILKHYKWHCLAVVICIVLTVLAQLNGTLFLQKLYDSYLSPMLESGSTDFTPLLHKLIQVGAVYAIGVLCSWGYTRLMVNVSQGTMRNFREKLFGHMESLPISYFDTHSHGDIMSVYTNDIDTLRQFIGQSLPQLFSSIISIVSVFVSMIVLNVPLTLLTLVMVALMLFATKKIAGKSGKFFVRQQQDLGKVNGYIEEMMQGQKVVKVFNHEQAAIERFDELNEQLRDSSCRANSYANVLMPVNAQAVPLQLEGGGECRVRLIDCVGYMVEGAMGHEENDKPRMVKSPWFDHEVPFDLAAETGTRKVICEHSTIGIVVTTDGSVSDIPREGYARTEKRIVEELDALGKPYIILLNSTHPDAPETKQLAEGMARDYDHTVLPVSCVDLDAEALGSILRQVLYEFPVQELDFALPRWVTMLENGHWLQTQVYDAAMQLAAKVSRMKDVPSGTDAPALECDAVQRSAISGIDLANGSVRITVELKPEIFYQVLSEQTGLAIGDEAGLMPCIMELAKAKREYEKVRSALEQVEATGYGIVMPTVSELKLEQPQIVRQGTNYGVRLEACAPSIQMMKATIHTEISPIVGTEKQSEDLARSLLAGFEDDPEKLWESNIFGKSLHELVNEGLQNKLLHMPQEARTRLQETLERVINEGCTGLICILI